MKGFIMVDRRKSNDRISELDKNAIITDYLEDVIWMFDTLTVPQPNLPTTLKMLLKWEEIRQQKLLERRNLTPAMAR